MDIEHTLSHILPAMVGQGRYQSDAAPLPAKQKVGKLS